MTVDVFPKLDASNETLQLTNRDLDIIHHPDLLTAPYPRLTEMDISHKQISCSQLIAGLLSVCTNSGVYIKEYECRPHGQAIGTEKAYGPFVFSAYNDFIKLVPTLRQQKEYEVAYAVQANLVNPQKPNSCFLFIDLDTAPDKDNLSFIKEKLMSNHFPGFIINSGASYYYIGSFIVPTLSAHLFFGRLICSLTDTSQENSVRFLHIGYLLQNARTLTEAAKISADILGKTSPISIPSSSEPNYPHGVCAVDVRYLAHRIIDQAEHNIGIGSLRVSDKPSRPEPLVTSIIF